MYKQLRNSTSVLRLTDGACIPADPQNADFAQFVRWRDGWTEKLEDGTEVVHPPHVPALADPAPPPTQDEIDAVAARADAKVATLAGRTPAQHRDWVNRNFPSLTDPERDKLGTLAVVVGILARRI